MSAKALQLLRLIVDMIVYAAKLIYESKLVIGQKTMLMAGGIPNGKPEKPKETPSPTFPGGEA